VRSKNGSQSSEQWLRDTTKLGREPPSLGSGSDALPFHQRMRYPAVACGDCIPAEFNIASSTRHGGMEDPQVSLEPARDQRANRCTKRRKAVHQPRRGGGIAAERPPFNCR
jgi:hypothetical protein